MKKNIKIMIIGAIILVILIVGVMSIKNKRENPQKHDVSENISTSKNLKNPEETVKKYCDNLVGGSFGDILELVYFPESEFITKDKIEEIKPVFFEKMTEENNDIVNCTYSEANETDDIITYKLIMETTNGNDTQNIDIRKKDNKIILEDMYADRHIKVFKDSKISIDGEKLEGEPKSETVDENNVDIYTITVLPDAEYDIKVTHSIFNDMEVILNEDCVDKVGYPEHLQGRFILEGEDKDTLDFTEMPSEQLKEECKNEIESSVCEGCSEIVQAVLGNSDVDIDSLNQYFCNNNVEEFIADSNDLNGTKIAEDVKQYDVEFKGILDTEITGARYIDDNNLKVFVDVMYQTSMSRKVSAGDESTPFLKLDNAMFGLYCTKDGNEWKIDSWDEISN